MKKILMIIGLILAAGLIAAGSFWGGMKYQSNQADQVRASFLAARGISDQGQNGSAGNPGAGQFRSGGGGFFGGGTTGQVKTIEGNVMTLSTPQDVTTVNLTNSTQIEKTVTGAVSDLQPGMRVIVTGDRDNNGNITANRVSILSDNLTGAPFDRQFAYPPPTNSEQ